MKENCGGVAAFFDLDGTLAPLPSLERRFTRVLRYRREIPTKNYFLWLREALRLMPRGITAIFQANKMYLRNVQTLDDRGERDGSVSSWHKVGHPSEVTSKLGVNGGSQAGGQASALPSKGTRRNPRLPVPSFFPRAIERVAWHVNHGHEIVLVSGTIEPLARSAARLMEAELAARGIRVTIRVCATQLEELGGKWTGQILGEAMFGKAKACAARRFAVEKHLDLTRCYAYGDSVHDQWLLAAVGRPAAVNPSPGLGRIARKHAWPVLRWNNEKELTQRTQKPQRAKRSQRSEKISNNTSVEKSVPRRTERCA